MMSWWHYLLLVNLYLVLFFGFYRMFLYRETFFQLNRIYLISASFFSFIIPMMQLDWIRQLFITQKVHETIYATVSPQFTYTAMPQSLPLTFGQVATYVYIAVALFLLGRLIYQLLLLKKLINSDEAPSAFSFFKKIKVDAGLPGENTIIAHEQVHSRQWHSADVLMIEAVMILNWFNPVVYFYRKAIKNVHEYIADRKAIEAGTSKTEYALLLLSQTFGTVPHELTNNFFNHSLLKQRILMLNQDESKRRALLKYGLSAPLFAAMLILSSATVNNSKIIRSINKKTDMVFIRTVHFNAGKDLLSETLIASHAPIPEDNRVKGEVSTSKPTTITVTSDGLGSKDSVSSTGHSIVVFSSVETPPSFPGGEQAFGRFINENVHYPDKAKQNHTTGRVFVSFIVEKDGALSNFKCIRDPGDGLGQEAMRVLEVSPKWSAAVQNGKPVRMQFTVPIKFSLANDGSKLISSDTSHAKKAMMVFVYKHGESPDSLNKTPVTRPTMFDQRITMIRLNGKKISKEEMDKISPNDIESISIIKRDSIKNGSSDQKNMIMIRLKESKITAKG